MQRILKDQEINYIYSKMIRFLMVCGKKSKAKRILEDSIDYAIENLNQEKKDSLLVSVRLREIGAGKVTIYMEVQNQDLIYILMV